jgi:F0F1-type ATP synthase gamma subunit
MKSSNKQYQSLLILRNLARAYAEIAATRMQKTRKSVLVNREFAVGINNLFRQILYSYPSSRERRDKPLTFLSSNGRPVAVLFSANTGLYGSIIRETFDLFYKAISDIDIEVTIVGRLGELFCSLFS